jgi:hypothetical protein
MDVAYYMDPETLCMVMPYQCALHAEPITVA